MNIGDVVKSSEYIMYKDEYVEKFHVVAETKADAYGDLILRLDPPGPEPSGHEMSPFDEPGWTKAFRVELVSQVQK